MSSFFLSRRGSGGGGGGGSSALATLVAGMSSNSWAEFTVTGMDEALAEHDTAGTECRIPYAGATDYDPISQKIVTIGGDHGGWPALSTMTLNGVWTQERPSPGSHPFQQIAVNPYTGDIYVRSAIGTAQQIAHPTYTELRKDDGTTLTQGGGESPSDFFVRLNAFPEDGGVWELMLPQSWKEAGGFGQVAMAYEWFPNFPGYAEGVLTIVDMLSGGGGALILFDPLTGYLATATTGIVGSQSGYHNVSAYCTAEGGCIIAGGGNGGGMPTSGGLPANPFCSRVKGDLSITAMPNAPHHLGIFWGASLVGLGAYVYAMSEDEMWRLDPTGSGTWAQMADPLAGMLMPNTNASCTCAAIESLGCIVYPDYDRARTPKGRTWVYKP